MLAIQDILEVFGALTAQDNAQAKQILDRIVAMLTRLGKRGYTVREVVADYEADGEADSDPDSE